MPKLKKSSEESKVDIFAGVEPKTDIFKGVTPVDIFRGVTPPPKSAEQIRTEALSAALEAWQEGIISEIPLMTETESPGWWAKHFGRLSPEEAKRQIESIGADMSTETEIQLEYQRAGLPPPPVPFGVRERARPVSGGAYAVGELIGKREAARQVVSNMMDIEERPRYIAENLAYVIRAKPIKRLGEVREFPSWDEIKGAVQDGWRGKQYGTVVDIIKRNTLTDEEIAIYNNFLSRHRGIRIADKVGDVATEFASAVAFEYMMYGGIKAGAKRVPGLKGLFDDVPKSVLRGGFSEAIEYKARRAMSVQNFLEVLQTNPQTLSPDWSAFSDALRPRLQKEYIRVVTQAAEGAKPIVAPSTIKTMVNNLTFGKVKTGKRTIANILDDLDSSTLAALIEDVATDVRAPKTVGLLTQAGADWGGIPSWKVFENLGLSRAYDYVDDAMGSMTVLNIERRKWMKDTIKEFQGLYGRKWDDTIDEIVARFADEGPKAKIPFALKDNLFSNIPSDPKELEKYLLAGRKLRLGGLKELPEEVRARMVKGIAKQDVPWLRNQAYELQLDWLRNVADTDRALHWDALADLAEAQGLIVRPVAYTYKPFTGVSDRPFYHGTKAPITSLDQADPLQFSRDSNLFGEGLYLTDNPNVAAGYARTKGRGVAGKVLTARIGRVQLLDMTESLPDNAYKAFADIIDGLTGGNFAAFKPEKRTGEAMFIALKEAIDDVGLAASGTVDIYQDVHWALSNIGYDGLIYKGGLRVGSDYGMHNAVVIFPESVGKVRPIATPKPVTDVIRGVPREEYYYHWRKKFIDRMKERASDPELRVLPADYRVDKAIKQKLPAKVNVPEFIARTGEREGIRYDWRNVTNMAYREELRKLYFEPAAKEFKAIIEGLPESEMKKLAVDYSNDWMRYVRGMPSKWDDRFNRLVGKGIEKVTLNRVHVRQRAFEQYSQRIRRLIFTGTIGGNPRSITKNMTQSLLTVNTIGHRATMAGWESMFSPGGRRLLNQYRVMAGGRRLAMAEFNVASVRGWERLASGGFSAVDKYMNCAGAGNGAIYYLFQRSKKHMDELTEYAIKKYGGSGRDAIRGKRFWNTVADAVDDGHFKGLVELANRNIKYTQYSYMPWDMPRHLWSQTGKTALMFTSWPSNFFGAHLPQLYKQLMKGENIFGMAVTPAQRVALLTYITKGMAIYGIGAKLGYDMKHLLVTGPMPTGRIHGYLRVPAPVSPPVELATALGSLAVGGMTLDDNMIDQGIIGLKNVYPAFIPAGTAARQVIRVAKKKAPFEAIFLPKRPKKKVKWPSGWGFEK